MFERTDVGFRSRLLTELGVPHLFTTRPLDVGPLEVDGPELSERLRAGAGMKPDTTLYAANQVHGGTVLRVDATQERLGVGELPADGLWTGQPGSLLLVRSADCVPVLITSGDGSRVAAVHAGWRGLVAGVIPNALVALGRLPGIAPASFAAAIGPCVSGERYEVGPEVARAFEDAGLAEAVLRRPGARPHVDLQAAAATQLERAGLARIDCADLCTFDHEDDFWSYRRDVTHGPLETTGRLAALAAPVPS